MADRPDVGTLALLKKIIKGAYERGYSWANTSGNQNVDLLHKLYGVVTKHATAGSRAQQFHENDFSPEAVRALSALAYELVDNSQTFSYEPYEAVVAFLNGVRDGVWHVQNERRRLLLRNRPPVRLPPSRLYSASGAPATPRHFGKEPRGEFAPMGDWVNPSFRRSCGAKQAEGRVTSATAMAASESQALQIRSRARHVAE